MEVTKREEIIAAPMAHQRVTVSGGGIYIPPTIYFGPSSQQTICPYCQTYMKTEVSSKATTKTHCWAFLLLGCCLCCIPYYRASCHDRIHKCRNCKKLLGVH